MSDFDFSTVHPATAEMIEAALVKRCAELADESEARIQALVTIYGATVLVWLSADGPDRDNAHLSPRTRQLLCHIWETSPLKDCVDEMLTTAAALARPRQVVADA